MAVLDVNWNPSARQLRQFAVMLAVLLGLVAAWLFRTGQSPTGALAATIAAAASALLAAFRPARMRIVYVAWMVAAFPIGWLVSHLLLAAVFYLVITPIGMIMRICRYDPLQRRFDRQADTYWQPRQDRDDPQRYFKQY
jgi:hypothetical protein